LDGVRVQTIPILPSPNLDETAAFYAALGFEEHGRWANEYLILIRSEDGIEFHFWC
jgi:catechol 2,3-dioxygenase-like lactoylglutathione lyase family enzyme